MEMTYKYISISKFNDRSQENKIGRSEGNRIEHSVHIKCFITDQKKKGNDKLM